MQDVFGKSNTQWLSNVALVKKSNMKWRICDEFTNLNKVYQKDSFLLSRINLIVKLWGVPDVKFY